MSVPNHIFPFLVVFSTVCFFFTGRIGDKIRLQDFCSIINLLLIFLAIYNRNFRVSPLTLHFIFWWLYITAITFIFGFYYDHPEALILSLREIFYFSFFLICFYCLAPIELRNLKFLLSFLVQAASIVASIYALYFVVLGEQLYYGIGYFTESYNPAGSSIYFILLAFLNRVVFIYNNNKLHLFFFYLCLLLSILTGARTGMLIVVFFAATYAFLSAKIYLKFILIIPITLFAALVIGESKFLVDFLWSLDIENNVLAAVTRRFSTLLELGSSLGTSRLESWIEIINEMDELTVMGAGRGSLHVCYIDCSITEYGKFTFGLGRDSGFLKSVVEMGYIMSIVYYALFIHALLVVRKLTSSQRAFNLYFSFLLAMLLGEFSYELFQTAQGGWGFWLVTGILIIFFNNQRA